MIKELDIVELLEDIDGAFKGDQVVVLSIFNNGEAFDLEKVYEDGRGLLLYSVLANKVKELSI